jgi:DNA-binding response OmpR family regulator
VGAQLAGANRTLDVHVATLRTKLGRPELVQTVRGVGYRLGLPDPGDT